MASHFSTDEELIAAADKLRVAMACGAMSAEEAPPAETVISGRTCDRCGKSLDGRRSDARFCGQNCRKKSSRESIRSARPPSMSSRGRTEIEHGTWRGAKQHYRQKETPCEPCRIALRDHVQESPLEKAIRKAEQLSRDMKWAEHVRDEWQHAAASLKIEFESAVNEVDQQVAQLKDQLLATAS